MVVWHMIRSPVVLRQSEELVVPQRDVVLAHSAPNLLQQTVEMRVETQGRSVVIGLLVTPLTS